MNELAVRTLTGVVLIAVALRRGVSSAATCFAVLVAADRDRRCSTSGRGSCAAGAPAGRRRLPLCRAAGARAAVDPASATQHGLDLLLWVFIVTWSTDIGAYFAGAAIRQAQARAGDQPGQDGEGLYGGIAAATLLGGAWVLRDRPRRCRCLRLRPFRRGGAGAATCSKAG